MTYLVEQRDQEIADLKHDLREASLEIERHHKDFQRIRDVLDAHEDLNLLIAKQIRNIVG